jgi:hypothetical protein
MGGIFCIYLDIISKSVLRSDSTAYILNTRLYQFNNPRICHGIIVLPPKPLFPNPTPSIFRNQILSSIPPTNQTNPNPVALRLPFIHALFKYRTVATEKTNNDDRNNETLAMQDILEYPQRIKPLNPRRPIKRREVREHQDNLL